VLASFHTTINICLIYKVLSLNFLGCRFFVGRYNRQNPKKKHGKLQPI